MVAQHLMEKWLLVTANKSCTLYAPKKSMYFSVKHILHMHVDHHFNSCIISYSCQGNHPTYSSKFRGIHNSNVYTLRSYITYWVVLVYVKWKNENATQQIKNITIAKLNKTGKGEGKIWSQI